MRLLFPRVLITLFGLTLCPVWLAQSQTVSTVARSYTVYVSAAKGKCWPGKPIILFRPGTVMMQGGGPPTSQGTLLGSFEPDPETQRALTRELSKHQTLRVVSSLAEAALVLHVCAQYLDAPFRIQQMRPHLADATEPLGFRAGASGVTHYAQSAQQIDALMTGAFWELDTTKPETVASPNEPEPSGQDKKKKEKKPKTTEPPPQFSLSIGGQPVPVALNLTPAQIVQQFLKKLPALSQTIAVLPKPPQETVAETTMPKLIVDPLGEGKADPAKPVAETTADDSALRIETSLVVVPVMAMDKDGKFLPGLHREDFTVFEDNVKQEVSDFGDVEQPIYVALVLDVSGSTMARLEQIQDAALTFVEQLRPQDKVMVVSFSTEVKVDSEFTSDRMALTKAILRTRTGGATRIQDALDLILTERLQRVSGRKAMVIFSDGVDTASHRVKWEDVLKRVQEAGVLVYPVRYDTLGDLPFNGNNLPPNVRMSGVGMSKEEYEHARQQLQKLAVNSGGRHYEVADIPDAKKAFAHIAEELRQYYWLGYYPTNEQRDGSYRKLRVQVNHAETVIRAREGYRATRAQ